MTCIGRYAFDGCGSLKFVKIEDGNNELAFSNSYSDKTFDSCPLESVYLGRDISNSHFPFQNQRNLTSIYIGKNVTNIENSAFEGCTSLKFIKIEDGDNELAFNTSSFHKPFNFCSLENVYLGRNISYDDSYSPFQNQKNLTTLTIGERVTSIGNFAFDYCEGLNSVNIPNNVTNIGREAFRNSGLTSAIMSNNIIAIGSSAFPSTCRMYVKKGSKTLLTLWNTAYVPYEQITDKKLLPPTLNVREVTQTTAKVTIENMYGGYTYLYNGKEMSKSEFEHVRLKPETTQTLTLKVSQDDIFYETASHFTTKGLNPRISALATTASSITATGTHTEEDAKVVSTQIYIYNYNGWNSDMVNGNECSVSGLNPGWNYEVVYRIEVDYGGENTTFYTGSQRIRTNNLKMISAVPKVVSIGNAIVSATTNLEENEDNVGFEWRCVDWTDEFASNTGTAVLYKGTMEGYIKNLSTDKLWKFRPYYMSDDGILYYGDWMGIDPTNTSYFEPIVHTYPQISIEGNTAQVSGYALGGTDDVVKRGFKYWQEGKPNTRATMTIPTDAFTVEATGQQKMKANLTGLTYNTTYHYVAFATTSTGESFYGEEQMFTTPQASSKYATFYSASSAYTLPTGMKASVVTGISKGKLVYKVIAEGGKTNNVVPKGVAVMLTSQTDDASAYTLTPTESAATYTDTNWLHGSDLATTTTADGGNYWFYKLSYGASGSAQSDVFGWYWGAANGGAFSIAGHKAWLAVPKVAGAPVRSFAFDGEEIGWDETTDIENMEVQNHADDSYYDLQSRRIEKPTMRGIYIQNGKKIMIK